MIWCILLGLGLLIFLSRTFFFLVDVQGGSMIPALEHGDRVLAVRFFPGGRWLKKGNIVVLNIPVEKEAADGHPTGRERTLYIKRLIGLPGEIVAFHSADLPPLPPHLSTRQGTQLDGEGRWVWPVPAGHGFVKGDSFGFDSTLVGPIPLRNVRGVVVMRLHSSRRSQKVNSRSDWQSDTRRRDSSLRSE